MLKGHLLNFKTGLCLFSRNEVITGTSAVDNTFTDHTKKTFNDYSPPILSYKSLIRSDIYETLDEQNILEQQISEFLSARNSFIEKSFLILSNLPFGGHNSGFKNTLVFCKTNTLFRFVGDLNNWTYCPKVPFKALFLQSVILILYL